MNRAVIYLIIATSLYSVINVAVKYLGNIPPSQIVVFRAVISAIICSVFIWKKRGSFLGKNKKILFFRGFFGTIALISLFICIQNIPLAVAMTLINLSPILTVIISHFYLKNRVSVQLGSMRLLTSSLLYMKKQAKKLTNICTAKKKLLHLFVARSVHCSF